MLILAITGKAQAGKDTSAELIKASLEDEGKNVLITHYADILKFMCTNYFDWDGKKDKKGRSLLQHVGTDIVRKKEPDYWVNYMKSVLGLFHEQWDVVIIPDVRFPNEIEGIRDDRWSVFTVRVVRPGYDNGLTEEQKAHESECALDNYECNYDIKNDGSLELLKANTDKLIRVLKIVKKIEV